MRSGKSKARGKGSLSVYERLQQQKKAQADREAAKSHLSPKVNIANSLEDDIEIFFTDDEAEQERPLRKSPKKDEKHSPNAKSKIGASHSPEVKAAHEAVIKPDARTARPEPAAGAAKLDDQQISISKDGEPNQAAAQEEHDFGSSLEETQLQNRDKVPHAERRLQFEIHQEVLTASTIAAGLEEYLPGLRDRILDAAGISEDIMPLRPSLQKVVRKLESLLTSTVEVPGENNSILLIGPRGVGKTLAVERAAATLTKQFIADSIDPRIGFVRLTGLAHTDERSAFREIARQLCRIFKCHFSKQASLEDNLGFLRDMLKGLRRSHKVVIFILDEFDKFASKPKQTLLYNLLDAMQASDMQAGVVGMSCRIDVTEMLEKRVKSRFSYRRELILNPSTCDFDDLEEGPCAILASLLSLRGSAEASSEDSGFVPCFNASVQSALGHSEVAACLQRLCNHGNGSPRELGEIAIRTLCQLSLEESLMQPRHLISSIRDLSGMQFQSEAVIGLSILELFLLVAFFRLRRKGIELANFEMAFDEYSSLRRGGSYRGVDETAPRPSAFRAFERLISASLLDYYDSRAQSKDGLREFYTVTLQLTQEELEDGLQSARNCPPVLLEWLRKDVVTSHSTLE